MRFILIVITSFIFICCHQDDVDERERPIPGETVVAGEMQESIEQNRARKQWIDSMHRTAPGTDWRKTDYRVRMEKHRSKAKARKLSTRSGEEVIADGAMTGSWYEKGSKNQAGSVIATEYDAETDELYLIAAGGSLFKGPRDGSNWQVVNQDFQFEGRFLQFLPNDTSKRLVAMIDKIVHYSDDKGLSWMPSEGMNTYDHNWGRRKDARVITSDSMYSIVLLVQEWDPDEWTSRVSVFLSNDLGEDFTRIHSFQSGEIKRFTLCKPGNTEQLILMETVQNGAAFYDVRPGDSSVIQRNLSFDPELRLLDKAYLTGVKRDSKLVFFSYTEDLDLIRSTDSLVNWSIRGSLPKSPWSVGLYPVPSRPNIMLLGEVECYRTTDDGATWTKLNGWGEYYGDVENKLHADMMYFNEFKTTEGDPFLLISNHGGLNVSYDYTATTPNIGLEGLNVSQYYSVRTDPVLGTYVFAGSQDQGFQRAVSTNNLPLPFEQVISGDYGHIVFTESGNRLWTVYPGGWVTYYADPYFSGYSASWEVNSNHESVWMPPLMAHPDPVKNAVYLAGGNMHGGDGSYLIQLTADGGSILADQIEYDFRQASGGEVSAMAHSPINPDLMYVATTNGAFFYSYDGGQDWNKSTEGLPGAQYLYGNAIYPSPVDEQTVYVGGSGYDNPPVYRSVDGGFSFHAMDEGLPPGLVYDLTGDPEGKYLFAGTSTGPYIYIFEKKQWYDMSGLSAPLQNYWSVEYLAEQKRVRFGTYGRGIWDFVIEEEAVAAEDPENPVEQPVIFPNPIDRSFSVSNIQLNPPLHLYNQSGQLIRVWKQTGSEYRVGDLSAGTYYLLWNDGQRQGIETLFIH